MYGNIGANPALQSMMVLMSLNIDIVVDLERIFLRSVFERRNLLLCKRKNRLCGAVFPKVRRVCGSLNQGNWLVRGAQSPKLVLSV